MSDSTTEASSAPASPRPWAIVGAGRVGKTLGLLARRLGIPLVATWNRTPEAAQATAELLDLDSERTLWGPLDELAGAAVDQAEVVWVTVVDDAVASAAADLAAHIGSQKVVLHTAGSLSSRVLGEAGVSASVGSLHPLQAITDPRTAVEFLPKAAWTVEGDPEAIAYAMDLMARIGVEPVQIDPRAKTLYHASAVTVADLLVSLVDAAMSMAELAGMSRRQARRLLVPLARSCVDNLERQEPAEALSGPAARGDQTTIERHLRALEEVDDEQLRAIYEVLTERAKKLAQGSDSHD